MQDLLKLCRGARGRYPSRLSELLLQARDGRGALMDALEEDSISRETLLAILAKLTSAAEDYG